MTWLISCLLIILASFISGCQQDEMPQVNNTSDNENSSMERNSQMDNNSISFEMLNINHVAMFSNLPDYNVILQNNGVVIFNGRKNTAFIGMKKLIVQEGLVTYIKELYIDSKFVNMGNQPVNIDLPINTTIFKANFESEAISKIDYNNASDRTTLRLIQLRNMTEKLLGVEKLIYKN